MSQGLVVFAKDVARVSAFYCETLGLTGVDADSTHHLLRGGGYEIVVHAIPAEIAATIHIDRPPQPREDSALKPTYVVEDLTAVRTAAVRTGGYLKPAEQAWHIRGCTVLDGWDPEGNVIQFTQQDL